MHFINSAVGLAALLAAPAEAFFRMGCGSPIVTERIDPIISPGQVSGHVHQVVGGNGFGFTQDFAAARRSTCTSCTVSHDLSNYWTPILYYKNKNGKLQRVEQNGGVLVYYLQRPETNKNLKAFPENFRMVAGDPFKRNATSDFAGKAVSFACLNYDGAAKKETPNLPPYNCPNGVRAQVFFPSCWDGKNTDSPDHKSHVSYPASGDYNNGPCPASHPVQLVSIFYEVIFNTHKLEFWAGDQGTNQPFIFAQGDATGYGFHGDFLNGWDIPLLQKAVDQCRNLSGDIEDCPVLTPYLQTPQVQNQCTIPDSIGEDVTGPFDKLPGCNPITAGPARAAAPAANCAITRIAGPKFSFTDKLSAGWAYQGCAPDSTGTRTLTGYSNVYNTDQGTTSVDSCIAKCKGFQYMGLEYGKQCFCGNSLPSDRVPSSTTYGQCNMPCAGNSTQLCGGGSQLSLYKACTGSGCANAAYKPIGDLSGGGGSSISPASSAAAPVVPAASSAAAPAPAKSLSTTVQAAPAAPRTTKPANNNAAAPPAATTTTGRKRKHGRAHRGMLKRDTF
ncbi:hypothetical protein KVT40_005700 [Elsinoe batatas]|uniref:WSC domain-containing protein n=1 Tax=Elsinoe batatas TaxID=2601811 RepID=A0A8K0L3I5_9PEZI|nr:hypothetical protein KVT40_005700 [Elsinoe batatas]